MSWNQAFEGERRAALSSVDDELKRLPAGMREQGRLFRAGLLAEIPSGDLADAFSGEHDYPGLYLQFWVLESRLHDDDRPTRVAPDDLTRAAFYTAAALRLSEKIADPASLVSEAARPLLEHFRGRAVELLAGLSAPFALHDETIETAWSRFADRTDLLAPHKLAALSAWSAARRRDDLPRLDGFLDRLNGVYRFVRGVRSLLHLLHLEKPDAFVQGLLESAGISASDPDWAGRLMGALIVSDPLGGPARAAQVRLAEVRAAAAELGLGGFTPYFDYLQHSLDRAPLIFKPGPPGESARGAGDGFVLPANDFRRMAIAAAEAWLTADLTFRESWEVHRYGLFGRAEVTSRFPAGLALEILCETGRDLAGTVDDYLGRLAAYRFGYFEDSGHILRDADTLGLALRLWRYRTQPEAGLAEAPEAMESPTREMPAELEEALATLERAVGPDGRIPVWLDPHPGLRLAGEGCGVVEAHLLLGLLAFDAVRFETLIARSAAGLFARFAAFGPGISINYPGLYALDAVRRLASAVERAGIRAIEDEKWRGLYRSALATELSASPPGTPQEAAFAIAACADPAVSDLRREDWPVQIYKGQRPDGSWNAEPFCFVANRGNEATPYSSRTLTTAFCWRALRVHRSGTFEV